MQSLMRSNSTGKHACNAGKDVEADKKQKIQILAILVRISGLIGIASAMSPLSMSLTQRMSPICFACNNSKQAHCHMWHI
jgi:4-hydroxybenzoate polyprenyltransferase